MVEWWHRSHSSFATPPLGPKPRVTSTTRNLCKPSRQSSRPRMVKRLSMVATDGGRVSRESPSGHERIRRPTTHHTLPHPFVKHRNTRDMEELKAHWGKYVWGAVGGAIVILILGFWVGPLTTNGSATALATAAATDRDVTYCVANARSLVASGAQVAPTRTNRAGPIWHEPLLSICSRTYPSTMLLSGTAFERFRSSSDPSAGLRQISATATTGRSGGRTMRRSRSNTCNKAAERRLSHLVRGLRLRLIDLVSA